MRCDRRQLKVHDALRLDLSQPIAAESLKCKQQKEILVCRKRNDNKKRLFKIFHLLGNDFQCIICDISTFRCLKKLFNLCYVDCRVMFLIILNVSDHVLFKVTLCLIRLPVLKHRIPFQAFFLCNFKQ